MDRLLSFGVERLARVVRKRDGCLVHIEDVVKVTTHQFLAHHVNEVLRIASHFIEVFLRRVGSGALRKTQRLHKANHTQFFGTWRLVLEGWQKMRRLAFNHLVRHLNALFTDSKSDVA